MDRTTDLLRSDNLSGQSTSVRETGASSVAIGSIGGMRYLQFFSLLVCDASGNNLLAKQDRGVGPRSS